MNRHSERFSVLVYLVFAAALIAVMLLCICVGSVPIPLSHTLAAMASALRGMEVPAGVSKNIILNVRLPRVINVALVGAALSLCGGVLLRHARELNAFAIGEDNARHIGVNVRRVKLIVLITVSVLIGVCVSISGTISFVGLVTPHMARMLIGPNHKRLLPASMFSGAIFLLLADLVARTLLSPIELSIGVVTSLVGAAAFIAIFYRTRKAG